MEINFIKSVYWINLSDVRLMEFCDLYAIDYISAKTHIEKEVMQKSSIQSMAFMSPITCRTEVFRFKTSEASGSVFIEPSKER